MECRFTGRSSCQRLSHQAFVGQFQSQPIPHQGIARAVTPDHQPVGLFLQYNVETSALGQILEGIRTRYGGLNRDIKGCVASRQIRRLGCEPLERVLDFIGPCRGHGFAGGIGKAPMTFRRCGGGHRNAPRVGRQLLDHTSGSVQSGKAPRRLLAGVRTGFRRLSQDLCEQPSLSGSDQTARRESNSQGACNRSERLPGQFPAVSTSPIHVSKPTFRSRRKFRHDSSQRRAQPHDEQSHCAADPTDNVCTKLGPYKAGPIATLRPCWKDPAGASRKTPRTRRAPRVNLCDQQRAPLLPGSVQAPRQAIRA